LAKTKNSNRLIIKDVYSPALLYNPKSIDVKTPSDSPKGGEN